MLAVHFQVIAKLLSEKSHLQSYSKEIQQLFNFFKLFEFVQIQNLNLNEGCKARVIIFVDVLSMNKHIQMCLLLFTASMSLSDTVQDVFRSFY